MPKTKSESANSGGELENARIMLLSAAVKLLTDKKLDDGIIVFLPDTGKAKFNGSHEYTIKSGSKKGETAMSKAIFTVAEIGSSYEGAESPFTQSKGDVDELPLKVTFSVIAVPPNQKGTTIDAALNRKPVEVEAAA